MASTGRQVIPRPKKYIVEVKINFIEETNIFIDVRDIAAIGQFWINMPMKYSKCTIPEYPIFCFDVYLVGGQTVHINLQSNLIAQSQAREIRTNLIQTWRQYK